MKTIFRITVMLLVAAFYSCQKNEITIGNSSITSDGVLSGTIVNDSNRIDSIKVYGENLLGNGTVSAYGKFSTILTTPVLRKIGSAPSGVVISDTTAMVFSVDQFKVFKGIMYQGNIYKSNYNVDDSINAGESTSEFTYSNRLFTIKGQQVQTYTYNGLTYNLKANYNVTFKKGWNEVVLKIDFYSKTTTTTTLVETLSNFITSDLQWRYYPHNASYVRAKTQGVQDVVRQGFLFR